MNNTILTILDNPLFNITFFGGVLFMIVGAIMYRFPPKKINPFYGYRTTSSMENQEKWDFAQKFAAKEMFKLGFLLMICSLFGFISKLDHETNLIIGMGFLIFTVIVLLFRVEKSIKIHFSKK